VEAERASGSGAAAGAAVAGCLEPETDLLLLLSQTSHALNTELTAGLARIGFSPRGYCVLSTALEGGLTQNRLAERCALDKTTMVVTLDELEGAGLAERRPSSTDRRARIIAVTPAGERKVAGARAIVAGVYGDVLAALPATERDAFVSALNRLVNGRLSAPVACERPVRRRVPRASPIVP
jgi:MarR family transcriptional regulator, transcriptional regulator for hemolysin